MKKTKILVVGQTPPPHGGQAIMIERMLQNKFNQVKLYHVRMSFSSDMDEIGKFKAGKLIKLIQLILNIYYYRLRFNIHTLYYPPAPPLQVPMFRDIVVLNATRWLFKTTIFHFHAAGISEMHPQLKGLLRFLFEKAYFYPDICIRLSEFNPEDGKHLKSKQEYIVPNGLDDFATPYLNTIKDKHHTITILSVGVLCESKGVMILLEAIKLLVKPGCQFKVQFMGRFESEAFRSKVFAYIDQYSLQSYIDFLGVQTGTQKYLTFNKADIFCFPTFFEAETFGLVALEAMQFKIPVVATRWRGVPSVVQDGVNGFLVPPKNAIALAEKLEILINNKPLRDKMGNEGRKIYLSKFTSQIHYKQLEDIFSLT
ncbi:glycosyltransferase [Rhodocytophaga aerolata]|uniref:Glycosyltransferase n=1 Tax=Rhodocytophaga aerolata TaxID=455078 RepID=A0ABT8RJR8_9BACT|nr:glycosyltransferase [Rhodocytophaga aerolata]MDO1451210.1 glycosyltransferase [Rhodocytophaga aerolata]